MTMSRKTKAGHQDMILGADTTDEVDRDFVSPTEIVKRGGRRRMNRAEYIVHAMGRRMISADQAEGMREARRRYRRRPVRR